MNNKILEHYNSKFMLGQYELKSFDIVPNTFLDMQQMIKTNKVKIQLFNIKSNTISDDSDVSFEIEHFIKNEAFLLVFGGWIPCTFIKKNTILLADRNVLSEIRRRYKDGIKKVEGKPDSFDNIFLNNDIMLDISPFVIEGNERKIPTNDMINEQIISVEKDIQVALPSLKIATYPDANINYHKMKNLLKETIENRMIFLEEIAPKLNKQFTKNSRGDTVKIIFETAKKMQVKKDDFVIILALLRVLMKGKKTAAQLVLKDSQLYSEKHAYNTAFDLSLIEMLINLHIWHEKNTDFNIALITQDKGLALFSSLFSNIQINGRANGKIKITANILYSIFHDDEELLEMYKMWLKGEV